MMKDIITLSLTKWYLNNSGKTRRVSPHEAANYVNFTGIIIQYHLCQDAGLKRVELAGFISMNIECLVYAFKSGLVRGDLQSQDSCQPIGIPLQGSLYNKSDLAVVLTQAHCSVNNFCAITHFYDDFLMMIYFFVI